MIVGVAHLVVYCQWKREVIYFRHEAVLWANSWRGVEMGWSGRCMDCRCLGRVGELIGVWKGVEGRC